MAKTSLLILRCFVIVFCVDITVSQPINKVDETLLQKCLREEGLQGKELEELTAGQRGQVVGCMNREHKTVNEDYKSIAVLHYFRIRLDYLQWTLEADKEVQKVLNEEKGIPAHPTPVDIPEDGEGLFQGRYKVWYAIYKVLCMRSLGNEKEEERDYVREFKNKLKSVGLQANIGTEEKVAADTAYLIVNLSGYSTQDHTNIVWDNEEDIMRALSKWLKIQGDQQKIARAVYRLKMF